MASFLEGWHPLKEMEPLYLGCKQLEAFNHKEDGPDNGFEKAQDAGPEGSGFTNEKDGGTDHAQSVKGTTRRRASSFFFHHRTFLVNIMFYLQRCRKSRNNSSNKQSNNHLSTC